jgi:hypothetical protein
MAGTSPAMTKENPEIKRAAQKAALTLFVVIAGLDPAIHLHKRWITGSRRFAPAR